MRMPATHRVTHRHATATRFIVFLVLHVTAAVSAGDPRNLGPGSYDVRPRWQGNSPHGSYKPAPGFDGGMTRFPEYKSVAPPPGAYEPRDVNQALRPHSRTVAAFGVSDARLPRNSKYLPGPGEYNLVPTWQKRSYNISFDDTQLL